MKSERDTRSRWRADFPIHWEEDEYVTRREFTRFLGLTSFALFFGTAWIALSEQVKRWRAKEWPALRIAEADELAVGKTKLFHYPTEDDPCLLIRLSSDRFVAYSQLCTHLTCPVVYEAGPKRLRCPCHEGYFSAEDGAVLGGPPRRPLPKVELAIRGPAIWTGKIGGT